MPGLDAGAPGLKDGGDVRGGPLEFERAAGQHHQDHRLAGGDDGLEQLFLRAGKAQMRAAAGFAFHPVGRLAQGQDGDVGLLRGLHGFGDGLGVVGDGLVCPRRRSAGRS